MALVSKLVARMAVGMYDWQAAHEMHASEVYRMQIKVRSEVYRMQMKVRSEVYRMLIKAHSEVYRLQIKPSRSSQPASPPPHRPNSDERVPKLLALHPQVNLALLTSPKEYQEILIGLAQVAKVTRHTVVYPAHTTVISSQRKPCHDLAPSQQVAKVAKVAKVTGRTVVAKVTGRTVVYPDVPCDLKWVSQHDGPTKPEYPPLDIKGEWFAHFRKEELCTVQDGDKDKRKHFLCMWAFLSFDDCFND
eukprot:gene11663-34373_t